jgi:hypothetical protein
MLKVTVDPLWPCIVTLDGLNAQDDAEGCPEHEKLIFEVKSGCGVNWTWYVAISPATGILWFEGLTDMLKSDIVAGTVVWANTILPWPITCTVPPLNVAWLPLLFEVGIKMMVTVAVEPDCN